MKEETALVVAEELNPVEIFSNGGIDAILEKIRVQAMAHVPVLDTAKGRKDIAAIAYKVSRSKTLIDDMGKNLVADWKAKSKKVDEDRKKARDYLDALKDEVRKPLTDWEAAEQAKKDREIVEAAWDEAIVENDLFNRQKEIERKEAEFARIEAEKKAKEEAERLERERIEREKRIAEEAAERAKKAAEESARKEQERIAREKKEAEERAAQAERDRIAAIERAKVEAELAEKRRLEAEQKAKEDQERAVKEAEEKARREAEAKEEARLAEEARQKAEAERLARNKAHQKKINTEALACFVSAGFTEAQGKSIIEWIARGKIKHITINY